LLGKLALPWRAKLYWKKLPKMHKGLEASDLEGGARRARSSERMRLQNSDGQRTFPADATRETPRATYTKQKEGAAINNQMIEASPKKI